MSSYFQTVHSLGESAVGKTKKHSRQLASMQTVEAAAVQSGPFKIWPRLSRGVVNFCVPSSGVGPGAADAVDKDWEAFDHHQANAARLDFAEEARTLLDVVR